LRSCIEETSSAIKVGKNLGQESDKTVIFPIFHFQVSEDLDRKFREGFEFSNRVKVRQIQKEELGRFREKPPGMWHDAAYLILEIKPNTFVFEVRDVEDIDQAFRLVYEVLLAMRLQSVGTIFYKVYSLEERHKEVQFVVLTLLRLGSQKSMN